MRKLLLSSVFVTFLFSFEAGNVQAQTCTATPECASLGYTKAKADCPKGALKCPYGNSYFCEEQTCQIGWIYYADGTCNAELFSDKTALGVVVYVNPDGIGGQVVSAWPVDKNGNKSNSNVDMIWGGYGHDLPNLPNYTSESSAAQDFSSCDNTDTLVAHFRTNARAAWVARSYAPTDETKGKWCLPAAGVMTSIYNNQSAVQAGISKMGGVTELSGIWTSSEYDGNLVWYSRLDYSYGGYGLDDAHKHLNFLYVRPVLEY